MVEIKEISNEPPSSKKTPMTEEERAALCQKLDDELEAFMEEMASKKKSENKEREPFDFDKFCKELDEHPAFMKNLGDAQSGKYAETIEALQRPLYKHPSQAMKYDVGETDEEKRETAEGHKMEGNKHFKLKKYRWAAEAYTNGIKVHCVDRELNAVLYQNRAATQAHIGNMRSAVKDCATGRRFDPRNLKIAVRGAECLLKLGYAADAIRWIDSSLKLSEEANKDVQDVDATGRAEVDAKQRGLLADLRDSAVKQQEQEDRDRRKKRAEEAKDLGEKKKLLSALSDRGLNFRPRLPFANPPLFEWSLLEVGQTDVMTECDETTMVGTLLGEVLNSPAEWDPEHRFKLDSVSFFVSDEFDEYLMEVYPWTDFKSMFSYPGYQIRRGLPVLMVFTTEKVDKSFKSVGDKKFVVD